jgi:stage II sporulation protein GA (sporulation sigma-E factor processing peptidase)
MPVLYLDTLLLVNLSADYLLLLATAKICGLYVARLRILLGAVFGAAYAAVSVLLPVLSSLPVKISAGVLMVLIVFGSQKKLLKPTVVFCGMAALLGGAVLALSCITGKSIYAVVDWKIFLFSFVLCYVTVTFAFRRTAAAGIQTEQVTVELAGRKVTLTALVDTGNSLTDPVTGKRIIVAEPEELMPLFAEPVRRILKQYFRDDPVRVVEQLAQVNGPRFRLVPYSTVGVRGGMLAAFCPDQVAVDGKKKGGLLVALAPNPVSDGAYSALMGVL